jgi:putative membrane protein
MIIAASLALAAGGLAACGQPASTTTETTTTETAPVEPAAPTMEAAQPFLDKIAATDMLEIEASKAAQTKSKNAEVKALAAMLVKDHTKTTTELKDWASKNPGFTLPTAAPADVQASIDNIKNAAADDGFDDKYLDTVIDAHEDAIELVGKYAANGDNDSLKQWAAATLPTLKAHFDQAQALREKLNKA